MAQILALVLFVTGVAIWWRYAARQKKHLQASAATQNTRNSYHCVEVRKGVRACKAAQDIGNIRFLSDQAPSLPVSGCTAETCTCSFIHHDDRREDDRRHPYGQLASIPPVISGERRSRSGRRKSQESTFRQSITG